MTSIHSLPVELITRIFLLGSLDPVDAPSSAPPWSAPRHERDRAHPFEVLVSHVCIHWRAVALRTPALWTNIVVRTVPQIARARAYLSRALRCPLSLTVDSAAPSTHVPGHTIFRDEFLDAFRPLTPHIRRWRALTLYVRDQQCKLHARSVLSTCGPAPVLESLALWHIEDWRSPEQLFNAIGPPPVVVFNGDLPALSHLSLIGVNIQWSAQASPFLRALTELELGVHSDDVRIPFSRWRDILRASPQLTRLALHYSGPRAGAGHWHLRGEGRIALPSLRDIRLVDLDAPYACAILRTIEARGVRRLALELGLGEDGAEGDAYPGGQDYTPFLDLLADQPEEAEDVVDPTSLPPPRGDEDSGGEEGAGAGGEGGGKRRTATPMFPELEALIVVSLQEFEPASWRRLLRRTPALRVLEADFGAMSEGAFDVLLEGAGARGPEAAAAAAGVLLPGLHTVRLAGVFGGRVGALVRRRREAGRPVARWFVHESVRDADADAERVKAEMDARAKGKRGEGEVAERMEWYRDEDEDEEGEGSGGEEQTEEMEDYDEDGGEGPPGTDESWAGSSEEEGGVH